MPRIDLHLHSTASDGRFSPAEVVRKTAGLGLIAMALTDHDSVGGIAEALETGKAFPNMRVIPGVEINTDVPGGEVHILGYFIDYTDPKLLGTLGESRDSRETRGKRMVEKLDALGLHLEWRRVKEIAGDGSAIGRPHIAQALLEKGYIKSIREAFDKYIGQDGPALVERDKKTPEEAVQMVLAANGLPVMAHPFTATEPEKTIVSLKAAGLVGLETYYGSYSKSQVDTLLNFTKKYGLIATGGSDYHGLDDTAETMMGDVRIPKECVDKLIALAKERHLKFVS